MPCLSSNYLDGVGPLIQVVITSLDKNNTGKYYALIDTGAESTCISERVVKDLDLKHYGQTRITTPSGTETSPIFNVSFGFVLHSSLNQDLVAMKNAFLQVIKAFLPQKEYDVLLGRDILCKGCFYMSNNGHFSFSF